MTEPINRLFFALWPNDAVRAASADAARQLRVRMQPGGYQSKPERYHLTLLFLGDHVTADREAAARQTASRVRSPPFSLRLDHAGSFRNPKIPWWLGSREPPAALQRLHDRLRDAMLQARVPVERMKFSPHLTIHRDAGAALPPTLIQAIDWQVQDFVLVRSRIDQSPVQYDILGRWPLDPDAPEDVAEPGQLSLL